MGLQDREPWPLLQASGLARPVVKQLNFIPVHVPLSPVTSAASPGPLSRESRPLLSPSSPLQLPEGQLLRPPLWWQGRVHTSFNSPVCLPLGSRRGQSLPWAGCTHSGSSGEKGPPSTYFPQCSVPYRSMGLQSCCAEGGPLSPWGPLDWRGPCTGSVSDQWPHLPPAACLGGQQAQPGRAVC